MSGLEKDIETLEREVQELKNQVAVRENVQAESKRAEEEARRAVEMEKERQARMQLLQEERKLLKIKLKMPEIQKEIFAYIKREGSSAYQTIIEAGKRYAWRDSDKDSINQVVEFLEKNLAEINRLVFDEKLAIQPVYRPVPNKGSSWIVAEGVLQYESIGYSYLSGSIEVPGKCIEGATKRLSTGDELTFYLNPKISDFCSKVGIALPVCFNSFFKFVQKTKEKYCKD